MEGRYTDNNEMKTKIINELYETNFVHNYVRKLIHRRSNINEEDAVQHCWLQILEIPSDKLIRQYEKNGIKGVIQFVSGVIYRQCISTNSTLYYSQVRYSTDNVIKKRGQTKRWTEEEGWEN